MTERSLSTRKLLVLAVLVVIVGAFLTRQVRHPTADEAAAFLQAAEAELLELSNRSNRAGWIQAAYLTQDTEKLAAQAELQLEMAQLRLARGAQRFAGMKLPDTLARKLHLLRILAAAPPPPDSSAAAQLAEIMASLSADHGRGISCRSPGDSPAQPCRNLDQLSGVMAASRDPAELLDAWKEWHAVGAPMRDRFTHFVSLTNQGAASFGFSDVGAMWRSGYEMDPTEFEAETDRLWAEVKPLYLQLHAYVRARLAARYGPGVLPPDGPIPAHLLGNMWARDWGNIFPLVKPVGADQSAGDITPLLRARGMDAAAMVRYGENFFNSMGFDLLPASFWQLSLLKQPGDREVQCDASAWDVDNDLDLRIQMCIQPDMEDFITIHRELGHIYYFREYRELPFLFRNGANDAFHEAIGDAVALAITPAYFQDIGLAAGFPDEISMLLRQAMDRVVSLPFGLLIDKWRWRVFDGRITPDEYNAGWWRLREEYQGVMPPLPRTEADFDPGTEYHIPSNTPYAHHFLAQILQFQLYKGLCEAAGQSGPLSGCTFYGSRAAGQKLAALMRSGRARPWPDILEELTGSRSLDAGPLLEYFSPLMQWLERQNQAVPVGW